MSIFKRPKSDVVFTCIITCIGGRPGSGKTQYAKNNFKNSIIVDDPENKLEFKLALENALKEQKHIVVVDQSFCRTINRYDFLGYLSYLQDEFKVKVKTEWIFFADDIAQCKINSAIRDKKEKRKLPTEVDIPYDLPKWAKTIPVWKPNE